MKNLKNALESSCSGSQAPGTPPQGLTDRPRDKQHLGPNAVFSVVRVLTHEMQNVKKRASIVLKKCSKSIKNDPDNILKSSQMAAGVRVGHPSEPLGREFVPRVAQFSLTVPDAPGHDLDRKWFTPGVREAVIFRRNRENGWPRMYPKNRF